MNLYHVLYKTPSYIADNILEIYEDLAKKLVKSGLLRIEAENKINFARFSLPSRGKSRMFSARELYDKNLLPRTKSMIKLELGPSFTEKNLELEIEKQLVYMKNELKKYQYVNEELELSLARILVQAAHPVILHLILLEKVEIFLSYSYNIGDMMDNHSWQHSGSNSGMQSNDLNEAAIFVSAGGDPFGETENEMYGDGKPALARMSIIAAQELGHYADLIRDNKGRKISRFSMNLRYYSPNEPVRTHRKKDMLHLSHMHNYFTKQGFWFRSLYKTEEKLKFFRKNRPKDRVLILYVKLIIKIKRAMFKIFVGRKFSPLIRFLGKEEYLSLSLIEIILDMKFNLSPQADVYRNENKTIEEAIQCAEALARVPQQMVKWGEKITEFIYPNLYKFYYTDVINSNIRYYESITRKKFVFSKKKIRMPLYKKIYEKILSFRRKM